MKIYEVYIEMNEKLSFLLFVPKANQEPENH